LNFDNSLSLNLGDLLLSIFFLLSSHRISIPVGSKNTYKFLYLFGIFDEISSYFDLLYPYTIGKGAFRYSSWSGM